MTNGTGTTAALRKLYSSSRSAKAAFDYFAQRQNGSARTTVDSLQVALRRDGNDVARSDIVDLFKSLEAAECGSFVIGRKGHPSRFEWRVSLIDVGRSAAGEAVKVEAITDAERADSEELDEVETLLEHRYRLRPEVELRFELPLNLTPAEAVRISDFIRTLPFA